MYKLNNNYYGSLLSFYFNRTIDSIIKIGDLDIKKKNILDFGCGYGQLKKKIKINHVLNYDIDPQFTEYDDWRKLNFDIIVANQVFYLFSKNELENLLDELKNKNPELIIIVGISYQNVISKIIKNIFNFKNAHDFTKLNYNQQVEILKKKCILLDKIDNFFANKVLKYKFK